MRKINSNSRFTKKFWKDVDESVNEYRSSLKYQLNNVVDGLSELKDVKYEAHLYLEHYDYEEPVFWYVDWDDELQYEVEQVIKEAIEKLVSESKYSVLPKIEVESVNLDTDNLSLNVQVNYKN